MTKKSRLSKSDFVARARLRHQLRLFERFTEEAALAEGVTLTQYLLLLQIKGRPDRSWALVGELADCLVLRHHTTVELVSRCESAGLVRRERAQDDLRKVRVVLTPAGERTVARIAGVHDEELTRLLDHVRAALGEAHPDLHGGQGRAHQAA
jgi:DNA-binding MarR family transcriptional regulator